MRTIIMAGVAWVATLSGMASELGDAGLESLRAFRIQPDTFDYVLTSYVQAGSTWIVSFNHRDGQTHFVQPGQTIGLYQLVDFEPDEEVVFVPSINATRVRKTGRATLKEGDGRTYTLTMGQGLGLPGWRAAVASLASGAMWSVRVGDTVRYGEALATVVSIAPDGPVAVRVEDTSTAIPMAQPEETRRLAELWERQERAKQLLARQGLERNADVVDQSDAARTWTQPQMESPRARISSRPTWELGWFFGTETRYPTSYEGWRRPDGSWIWVPRTFESKRTGVGGGRYSGTEPHFRDTLRSPSVPEVVPPYASPVVPHPEARRYRGR